MEIERLLVVVLLAVVIFAAERGLRIVMARRIRRRVDPQRLPQEVAVRLAPGRPNLLYFTADHCAQCRLRQTPILEQLAAAATISVHTIDAVAQEEVARFFGIMTVPTTILLDVDRHPVAVNQGVAPLETLRKQVDALAAR